MKTTKTHTEAGLPLPPLVRWYVCPLTRYGTPDFKQADGPHDDRKSCERTIGLMNRLACIKNEERVICEVHIHPGVESSDGLNHEAIATLNSISANATPLATPTNPTDEH